VARAAHSPALLGHLLAGFAAFDRSSLSPLEREVVALTVSFENECHYCMALHTAMLAQDSEASPIVAALRAGAPLADPSLDAIRRLARALLIGRGRVPADVLRDFEAAGFDEQKALDVVLGVGVYVLSTFTNIVTGAPVDPPFEAFRWQKPAPPQAGPIAPRADA
jgi:AhpD family alkylhydroperoxidase